jgi:hypothetical protein
LWLVMVAARDGAVRLDLPVKWKPRLDSGAPDKKQE